MPKCLDRTTLRAFATGELTADALNAAEVHLKQCGRCAKALAGLDVGDDLLADIRALEQARRDAASAQEALKTVEERVSTTLFGPRTE
jgi:anti-sigma factor RsiW